MKKIVEGTSPIKINIGLSVIGFNHDGKCLLDTILIPSKQLADEITIHEIDANEDIVEEIYEKQLFPRRLLKKHSISLALSTIKRITNNKKNYKIFIKKNIPLGSGLGGVSSNIAFVLKELNKIAEKKISLNELIKVAAGISLDAAFFVFGGPARARGIGNLFTPLDFDIFKFLDIQIISPPIATPTLNVFQDFKNNHTPKESSINRVIYFIKQRNHNMLKKVLWNDLTPSILTISPEIKKEWEKYLDDESILVFTGAGSNFLRIKVKPY